MTEVILSKEMLGEWQKEAEGLRSRLAQLKERIRVLRDVLAEAGRKSDDQPWLLAPELEPDEAFIGLRQGEAMRAILKEVGEPLTGQQIRKALAEKGYPLEKWGVRNAYFYAVAKNLANRGQITKMDDKRYVLSADPAPNSGVVDEDTEYQPVPPDPDPDEEWPPLPPPDLDDVESEW